MRAVARACVDFARVAAALAPVEASRVTHGPARAVSEMRARAAAAPRRSPRSRTWLRRWIRLADALMPDGGNCYRRVLLELALDRAAAAETVYFGLQAAGGPRSGHAWLASAAVAPAHPRYDAVLAL